VCPSPLLPENPRRVYAFGFARPSRHPAALYKTDIRHRQAGIPRLTFSHDLRLVKERLPVSPGRERHGDRQKTLYLP